MKKINFYFLLVLLLVTCNANSVEEIGVDNNAGEPTMERLKSNQSENAINYEVSDEQFVLRIYSDVEGSEYESIMEVFSIAEDSTKLFELNYTFDTSEAHWKIKQKDKVLTLAENLQEANLTLETLGELSLFMHEAISVAYWELVEPNRKDITLFSSIHYYESAINTLRRSIEQNTILEGTIHPGFLLDKNYFVFQEDDIVDLTIFDSEKIAELTERIHYPEDQQLVNFLSSTQLEKVSFSTLYNFYTTTAEFDNFLNDSIIAQSNGCVSANCYIGCGGDLGCCGNYNFCCIYSSTFCLIHDYRCENCAYWHCGFACQPTLPGTKTVKVLLN